MKLANKKLIAKEILILTSTIILISLYFGIGMLTKNYHNEKIKISQPNLSGEIRPFGTFPKVNEVTRVVNVFDYDRFVKRTKSIAIGLLIIAFPFRYICHLLLWSVRVIKQKD
jgi:hypothetical protein